ncbi:HalOD1 output domain-containing protein [Halobellus rarus]|uniref:HalOD1 output domain-containing protein n=1 Tax=Halobellus rarus TaxID=1126237 RepID=A0ABD6CJ45_9EURY|nr:HalOD1 output domain-containing protein [Halobellus rarus]
MEYDIEVGESVSSAVIRGVSALRGSDPRTVRPLAEVLDPEALDALFDARADDAARVGGRVSFVYNHCRVTVDNGEYLTVQLLETAPRITRDCNGSL